MRWGCSDTNGPVVRKTAAAYAENFTFEPGFKIIFDPVTYPRSEAPKSKAIPSRPNPWPMMAVSHTAV